MSMVKIDKNAHRPVRLNITPEDAKKGKRLDPCACAAARAIKRQMGAGDDGVYVHRGVTYVKQGKEWVRFKTSGALRLETIIFDRGGEFAPGEYDIQAPPLSMISPKEPSKKRSPGIKSRNAFATRARRTVPGTRPTARGVEQEDSE